MPHDIDRPYYIFLSVSCVGTLLDLCASPLSTPYSAHSHSSFTPLKEPKGPTAIRRHERIGRRCFARHPQRQFFVSTKTTTTRSIVRVCRFKIVLLIITTTAAATWRLVFGVILVVVGRGGGCAHGDRLGGSGSPKKGGGDPATVVTGSGGWWCGGQ